MRVSEVVALRLPVPWALRVAGLAAAAVLFTACGGDNESGKPPSLPSRTDTAQPSVTATVPSPTGPLVTRSRTPDETSQPEPTKTRTETTTETTTQTAEAPTASEETEPPAGATSAPAEKSKSDESGAPAWLWWLLGALLVAALVAIPLLVRASRRRTWRADLTAAEEEVGWFAQELLPELQQVGSAAELRGAWGVSEARVAAAEDQLTALAASGPDDAGTARAVQLRDAVRQSRERIRALAESSGATDVSRDLAAVSAELAATLRSSPSVG